MSPSSPSVNHIPSIEGLRAVAVLGVVLFHFDIKSMTGGFIGVDVFFVISGYLITRGILKETSNGQFSFRKFYIRRIARLLPASIVTILICFTAAVLLFSPTLLHEFSNSVAPSVFSLANIHFWASSGYFDLDSIQKPLLHFWSLSIEEQFYLFWPLLLVLIAKYLKSSVKRLLIVCFLIVISLAGAIYYSSRDPDFAFFWIHLRAWEFLIGVSLTLLPSQSSRLSSSSYLTMIGLIMLIFGFVAYDHNTLFPGFSALLPCVATGLLIISSQSTASRFMLMNPFLLFTGKISYSIYLVHWPIWVFYSYWQFDDIGIFEKILLIIATYLSASLLYQGVEKRFRLNRNQAERLKARGILYQASIPIFALLLVSWQASASAGWNWRVGKYDLSKRSFPQACEIHENVDKRIKEKLCVYGDRGSNRKILLLGDSHAGHLNFGLHQFSVKNGFSVKQWTFSGCPPLWNTYKIYGIKGSNDAVKQKHCKSLIKQWREEVRNEKYEVVILSSRWMWLYEPLAYGPTTIKRRDFLADRTPPILNVTHSKEVFLSAIQNTIREILKGGNSKVILFSQIPLAARNLGGCNQVPKLLYTDRLLNRRCDLGVEFEQVMQRLNLTDTTIDGMKGENVLSILPSSYFCNQVSEICKTVENGELLYRDSNHLNMAGSFWLFESIEDDLIRFLN